MRRLLAAALLALAGLTQAAAAPPHAGLPHGVTPEGFHYLGRAEAPATLVEYADFL